MIKITTSFNYDPKKLEDTVTAAAFDQLKSLVEETLNHFRSDIDKEGGSVTVEIKGLDNVGVKGTGLSDDLHARIVSALKKLSSQSD